MGRRDDRAASVAEAAAMGGHGGGRHRFLDRSKVRILLCDKDPKSSQEVTHLLVKCSYQGDIPKIPFKLYPLLLLTLGSSEPVRDVAFGCGHDNEGLFVGAAGLLALGGGALSFPSQISAKSFSYCLVDYDSPSAVRAPLLRNRKIETFYYVGLRGISVGGQMLSIPGSAFAVDEGGRGGVIVDSGTAVTRLRTEAYAALRDAFAAGTTALRDAFAAGTWSKLQPPRRRCGGSCDRRASWSSTTIGRAAAEGRLRWWRRCRRAD